MSQDLLSQAESIEEIDTVVSEFTDTQAAAKRLEEHSEAALKRHRGEAHKILTDVLRLASESADGLLNRYSDSAGNMRDALEVLKGIVADHHKVAALRSVRQANLNSPDGGDAKLCKPLQHLIDFELARNVARADGAPKPLPTPGINDLNQVRIVVSSRNPAPPTAYADRVRQLKNWPPPPPKTPPPSPSLPASHAADRSRTWLPDLPADTQVPLSSAFEAPSLAHVRHQPLSSQGQLNGKASLASPAPPSQLNSHPVAQPLRLNASLTPPPSVDHSYALPRAESNEVQTAPRIVVRNVDSMAASPQAFATPTASSHDFVALNLHAHNRQQQKAFDTLHQQVSEASSAAAKTIASDPATNVDQLGEVAPLSQPQGSEATEEEQATKMLETRIAGTLHGKFGFSDADAESFLKMPVVIGYLLRVSQKKPTRSAQLAHLESKLNELAEMPKLVTSMRPWSLPWYRTNCTNRILDFIQHEGKFGVQKALVQHFGFSVKKARSFVEDRNPPWRDNLPILAGQLNGLAGHVSFWRVAPDWLRGRSLRVELNKEKAKFDADEGRHVRSKETADLVLQEEIVEGLEEGVVVGDAEGLVENGVEENLLEDHDNDELWDPNQITADTGDQDPRRNQRATSNPRVRQSAYEGPQETRLS